MSYLKYVLMKYNAGLRWYLLVLTCVLPGNNRSIIIWKILGQPHQSTLFSIVLQNLTLILICSLLFYIYNKKDIIMSPKTFGLHIVTFENFCDSDTK